MPCTGGLASGRPCSVSAMDFGCPGRLTMSARPRMTAVWRDRMAVGTKRRLIWRICSPKPGITLSATASVASGVTSRGAGPVPPVVSTRSQPSASTSSFSAASIPGCSSGIRRVTQVMGLRSARASHSCSAGMPWSVYTPREARSLTETRPMRTGSMGGAGVGGGGAVGEGGVVMLQASAGRVGTGPGRPGPGAPRRPGRRRRGPRRARCAPARAAAARPPAGARRTSA